MPAGDDHPMQKPCALTSRRAPFSEFEVPCDSSSPVKAYNGGSIAHQRRIQGEGGGGGVIVPPFP